MIFIASFDRPSFTEGEAGTVDKTPQAAGERPESQPESRPESLRDRVTKLLQKGPLAKSEISKQLGQKQISGQLKKVLRELIEEEVLSFTLPDKPKSRLQRYRLTQKGQDFISKPAKESAAHQK